MQNNLAHTIRLYPTTKQDVFFKKACGVARVSYNYGLGKYKEILDSGNKPNVMEIKKQFNKDKKVLFPWMAETHRDANSQPFANLQSAFGKFFKKTSKFPRFKKKGIKDSFYIANDKFSVDGNKFKIPKLGWVKGSESLRFTGKIMSATVKRKANYWFVVVSVLTEDTFTTCDNQEVVGVDLGIKTLATLSNGEQWISSSPLRNRLQKLKFLQRRLSRKVKGSTNRRKQQMKVAKLHYEISCIRKDCLNKLTTHLCKNFKVICIEDLNVGGMVKNHKLALSISDMGFGEFRRQLEYKSKIHRNEIVVVDRFFPSSKTCSFCGGWQDIKLSDRVYRCDCGQVIDRDLNAAINLKNYGLNKLRAVSPEVTPVDLEALACRAASETTEIEAGILEYSAMNT
jgi:putative transposase